MSGKTLDRPLAIGNGLVEAITPYVQIARPDHWFKNVFMLPGVAFAIYDKTSIFSWEVFPRLVLAILATCLVASSNYTINEILDAPQDKLHPTKRNRPIPSGKVNLKIAYVEWIVLGLAGLLLGKWVNYPFFLALLSLLVMGMLYNIPPVRLKDLPYLDVLSESINNPIRLFLGWFALNPAYPPTLSLIMAYWMIGAFFMATKRFAEYKMIGNARVAAEYRKSFLYYNEYTLLLSIVYYCSAFALFFGIFIVRYRMELILSIPFVAGFIPMYLRLGFWANSPAQAPENLYRQKGLVVYTALCTIVILSLLFIDIPLVEQLFRPFHSPE